MQDDLPTLIRTTAAQARANDFVWSAAITAGVMMVMAFSGAVREWWLPVVAWLAFIGALLVRYRLSSGRVWALPVQRIVESQMSAQAAELERLRLARGVAESLPEPLFILDGIGLIEHANPAAQDFVGASELEGRHFASVVRAPAVFEALNAVAEGEAGRIVDFVASGAVERHCRAFVASLSETGDSGQALVYVRDLTSEHRLEQMRADFIASASHELRTPLASLLGYIETLRGHARSDPEAQQKFLGIMQAQGERMQRLVEDLMSLSKIELTEHVPPRDAVDLCLVAEHVIESLEPLAKQWSADLRFECACDAAVAVVGDRDQLTQTVQNLVDNAAKYGGDPAEVLVRVGVGVAPRLEATDGGERAYRAGDGVDDLAARLDLRPTDFGFVQVRDFGPGISRENLPRLTERFYRVDAEHSKQSGGTGLGLAIVKHIVNRHQGGLEIESRAGAGTVFTCYFRRAASP